MLDAEHVRPRASVRAWARDTTRCTVFAMHSGLSLVLALVISASRDHGAVEYRGPRTDTNESVMCRDPIAGTWTARRYVPDAGEWELVTLRIARDGDRLTGTITVRFWSGDADRPDPPACAPGVRDTTAVETAHGTFRNNLFSFEADDVRIESTPCASSEHYNLDSFTGRVIPVHNLLEAVNNDGGRDVDEPHRFRRLRCTE